MKHLFLTIMLLLAASSVSAQITHTAKGNVDLNAEKILKKASDLFAKKSVSFNVTMINRDGGKRETARTTAKVLYSKGRYQVSAGDQMLWCDGKSVWHLNRQTKEAVLNNVESADDDLLNPARLLANYSKSFRPKYIRTEDDGTAVLDLIPKQGRSYHKIRLLVVERTGVLKSMTLHNYDASEGEYRISDFKSGVACKDSDFVFNAAANKGVEVIDMR